MSERAAARTRRNEHGRRRRWLIALGIVAVLFAALAAAVAARGPFFFMSCDPDDLGPSLLDSASRVYSADGELLATLGSPGDQRPVRLRNISPNLRKATIAVEDRRFYEHEGIDYLAALRALFRDVEAGGAVQGGSTITQQLARNLYLGRERTFTRKLKEGCIAVELERQWSKDRILQTYLNTSYYGNGAYGAEAAARTYFSRPARDLTLEQAALLAGLPQAPSQLDPFSNAGAARTRRSEALQAMADAGEITEDRAAAARATELGLRPGSAGRRQDRSVVDLVLAELTDRYGSATVRRGGLRVYTTIRGRYQRLARAAIHSSLDRNGDPAAAVASIDPATGAVRAVASVAPGGTQFFNLAAFGKRQAGSAFKPFVLVEAVRRAINPWSTTYLSAPFEGPPTNGKPWSVETYDGTYVGRVPIAAATLRSDNTVYARLTLDVGPERVAELARSMGIQSTLQPVPSIGLGTETVSPLELASAYATLASGGVYSKPFLIRRVTFPDGREDGERVWGRREQERVLPPAAAYEVTRILQQNIEAGTGTRAQIDVPAAGKTGTTDDFADAWFAGYTPRLATAVWVGYPRARVPMTDVHGIAVAGGTFPAAIWAAFMGPAVQGGEPAGWSQPDERIEWKRWCGRYQYATTYRDARPEGGCPEPTTAPKQTTAKEATTVTVTTTAKPPPPPPPPPPAEPPAPPTTDLVGKKGKVTQPIDNDAQTGEVEIGHDRYPAQSQTGEPLPAGTKVRVTSTDGRFLYVIPE